MTAQSEWPIAVRLLDLTKPLNPISGLEKYPRVRVFVTQEETLLGSVDLWTAGSDTISVPRLRTALADHFGYMLFKQKLEQQLGADPDDAPRLTPTTVSIVVATCDRPDDLRRCLTAMMTQKTRHPVEIVVVDNRPASGLTAPVAREFPSVRLVNEERGGLAYARNAGFIAANGEIVIATDDDVTVPQGWIDRLAEPFARPEVMAVTGHVLPLELETEAQCRFEAYGGLGKGFDRFDVDGDWFRTRRAAVPTWLLGATANAAFRSTIFSHPRIGLMDEALGPGTPTGVGEDTYLFYKILKAGYTIQYEPSAYVWHKHRVTMENLKFQLFSYSKGHVAYHLTTLLRDGDRRALIRLFYSLPKAYARRTWARLRGRSDYPLALVLLELEGNLAGPLSLWRSRRRVQRLGRSAPVSVPAAPVAPPSRPAPITEQSHAVSMESSLPQSPAA